MYNKVNYNNPGIQELTRLFFFSDFNIENE